MQSSDELPIGPSTLVRFRGILGSEVALIWHRNDGVVITADALQHYGDWHRFNFGGWLFTRLSGFVPGTVVGPMWRRLLSYDDTLLRASFDRLMENDFRHAVALHGTFVRNNARERIIHAVEREFTKPLLKDWSYNMMIKRVGPQLEAQRAELKARGVL